MTRVAVIGGGLMGAGIAQVFLSAGHEVCVVEPMEQARSTLPERIRAGMQSLGDDPAAADELRTSAAIEEGVAGAAFVFEAAPEKLWIKRTIFNELEIQSARGTILASNTSVMPIGLIAAGLATADRIVGTHWWNPAPLIPLVEVVQAAGTSEETITRTMELLASVGKKPAHVKKDVAGFVANRLQHALWREAIAMVADGICDAKTVDDCVKNSFGLRLAVLGPLENADLVGLELTRDIHRTIIPELNRDAGPNPILDSMISAGRLGFRSGEGFRRWSADEMQALQAQLTSHLIAARRKTRP